MRTCMVVGVSSIVSLDPRIGSARGELKRHLHERIGAERLELAHLDLFDREPACVQHERGVRWDNPAAAGCRE